MEIRVLWLRMLSYQRLFFFSFIFISWRPTISQHCSGFFHTLTWISPKDSWFTCCSVSFIGNMLGANEHANCGRVPAKVIASDSSHPYAWVPLFRMSSEIHCSPLKPWTLVCFMSCFDLYNWFQGCCDSSRLRSSEDWQLLLLLSYNLSCYIKKSG